MAFCIMRAEKRKAGSIGGLEAEAERTEEINLPKSDIDWDRTKDNYRIVDAGKAWSQKIKDVLEAHDIKKPRKDAVLLIDGLYTASPDAIKEMSNEEQKQYFLDCVEFHRKYYGEVISAIVHLDESTPHLHVASVPVIERQDGSFSLSAKDIMGTPQDYRNRQDKFYEEVGEKYEFERGVRSDPVEKKIHRDTIDYGIEQDEKRANALEIRVEQLEKKVGKIEVLRDKLTGFASKLFMFLNVIRDNLAKLIDKIELHEPITKTDLKASACDMAKITTEEIKTPIYVPEFFGKKLAWDEYKAPAYRMRDNDYELVGAYDIYQEYKGLLTDTLFCYDEKPDSNDLIDMVMQQYEIEQYDIETIIDDIEQINDDIDSSREE